MRLVAPPVLGADDLAGGHDDADGAVLLEQVDDAADLVGALEHAVEKRDAPAVAVDAVLALLRMDLGDGVVAGEQALVRQAHEGRPVAALVRHDLDAGLGVPAHDARDGRLGGALGHRDEEVVGLRHARERSSMSPQSSG